MSHDGETKEGSPNLGSLPHSPSAPRTPPQHAPFVFEATPMLSWKVARCIRNSTMNVCVCDKLTGLRGAPRFIQSMGDQLPPICPPLHGATDRTLLYQTSAVCRIISRLGLMQDPPMERCQFVMWPQCRYCPINAALPLTD